MELKYCSVDRRRARDFLLALKLFISMMQILPTGQERRETFPLFHVLEPMPFCHIFTDNFADVLSKDFTLNFKRTFYQMAKIQLLRNISAFFILFHTIKDSLQRLHVSQTNAHISYFFSRPELLI